jgi:putative nucleotidyltransferase with HDIG domain
MSTDFAELSDPVLEPRVPAAALPPAGSASAMAPPDPGQMEAALDTLPPLPAVVQELIELLGQDGVGAQRLGAALAKDPALTLTTLRLANSSFYGVSRQVATVSEAVCVLGLRNLRGLVTAAAMASAFPARRSVEFDARQFWRHSIQSAVGLRLLAQAVGADEEAAFSLGLLHDVGSLAMAQVFPERWRAFEARRGQRAPGFSVEAAEAADLDAERALFGTDHAAVGASLLARWQFSPWFVEAVRLHHAGSSLSAGQHAIDPDAAWPALVQLGQHLSHGLLEGAALDEAASLPATRVLGLEPEAVARLAEQCVVQAETLGRALLN